MTIPFCVVFLYSGVWTLIDPDGAREVMQHLGFPTYFLYPQAIAKLLGVALILLRRWRPLTDLAFAGFLYDLLLAGRAHIAEGDPDIALVVVALLLWGAAFWAYHRRFPAPPLH